jgi:copper(I)-binding protein
MKTTAGSIALVLLLFFMPASTPSAQDSSSRITVSQAWARATPPSAKNGAVFLTITAPPSLSDKLVAARSSAAELVQLHRHVMDNGIARMQRAASIEIPQGKAIRLDAHGPHVMLVGLKSPLKEGERIPLTLVFEKSGDVPIDVPVLAANAPAPPSAAKARAR